MQKRDLNNETTADMIRLNEKLVESNDYQSLENLREDIAKIDSQIIELVSQRCQKAALIGKVKKNLQLEISCEATQDKVLKRYVEASDKLALRQETMLKLAEILINEAKFIQKSLTKNI